MRIKQLISGILIGVLLAGCQPVEEETDGDQPAAVKPPEEFYTDGRLVQMEIAAPKKAGGGEHEFSAPEELLPSLQEGLSEAKREPGIAEMTTPDYDVEATYDDDSIRTYHLWLGEEGQTSTWMTTEDSHSIYTTPPEMTERLLGILEN